MIYGKGPTITFDRARRRAMIIRRHRLMLEAEVRALLPDEDVRRVVDEGDPRP